MLKRIWYLFWIEQIRSLAQKTLMLCVSYKNVAFPLMFVMLDKQGNSNTVERIDSGFKL